MNRSLCYSWLKAAGAVLLGGLVLAFPSAAAAGFGAGVRLCLNSVLPALFPFFVVCELLLGNPASEMLGLPLRPVARLAGLRSPHAATALLLCWVGGYAVCGKTVQRLCASGLLRRQEGLLLMVLGCCSGPGFVVGCIGGLMLGSVRLGVMLYVLQLAANLVCAAVMLPFLPHFCGTGPAAPQPGGHSPCVRAGLPAAINAAVESTLGVCGCVIFFRIVCAVAAVFLPSGLGPVCTALLEISAGCADFAAVGGKTGLYGICFCLSFLGFSVYAQLAGLLRGQLPLLPLVLARLVHIPVLWGLVTLCARFLPGEAAAFSSLAPRVVTMNRLAPDAAVVCFLFLCCVLYKFRQTFYNR